MEIAIGIILILASIFLIIAVLMQEGKSRNLGAISGGSSDTFLGKSGASSLDKKLSRLTTIVAVVFVVLVVVMYLIQDTTNYSGVADSIDTDEVVDTVDTDASAETTDNASVDGTTAPAAEG